MWIKPTNIGCHQEYKYFRLTIYSDSSTNPEKLSKISLVDFEMKLNMVTTDSATTDTVLLQTFFRSRLSSY